MTSFLDFEDIIKKDFNSADNLVEITNAEKIKSNDFIFVVEVDNYDNKYYTYCSMFINIFLNIINDLQNRDIEEIDNEDDLTNKEIIELYEKHNNCTLYFFKEKTK